MRFALRALFVALIAMQSAAAQLPAAKLNAGIHVIRAEVANTFESRARGLMHRESLGPNQGMLFIFPEESQHCMWMKNTLIPLSVAFLDAKGQIINIAEMQPHSEQSHCAARPALYALEMTKGWFAAKGVRPGTMIQGLRALR
ncbi:MAG: DUF192 domain-containing protein [Betaproteobacteria bacterium]|nr:DUF192 domain-containing protein [Betaproteobacteria bacterium]